MRPWDVYKCLFKVMDVNEERLVSFGLDVNAEPPASQRSEFNIASERISCGRIGGEQLEYSFQHLYVFVIFCMLIHL